MNILAPYLARFINAHSKYMGIIMEELKAGKKESHWMWFAFPQIRGLGTSEMAHLYALDNVQHAKYFYDNKYLKGNLLLFTKLIMVHDNIVEVLGELDTIKFKSSMTLFNLVHTDIGNNIFSNCINKYFNGKYDVKTLEIISACSSVGRARDF